MDLGKMGQNGKKVIRDGFLERRQGWKKGGIKVPHRSTSMENGDKGAIEGI